MGQSIVKRLSSEYVVGLVLVFCLFVIVLWEVMAHRSRRPFEPFQLTAADFRGFRPSIHGWVAKPVPVSNEPTEPNIIAFLLTRRAGQGAGGGSNSSASTPVLVRLVHGYNMPDCMRIKEYSVKLIKEIVSETSKAAITDKVGGKERIQMWAVTARSGESEVWCTAMLRLSDFGYTDIDVRSMPFPRIGVPDEQGWFPNGITLAGFRHPIVNVTKFFRARWNASRCDLATFLRLRQPAWASDKLLTLVAASHGEPVMPGKEAQVAADVLEAQDLVRSELIAWRSSNKPVSSGLTTGDAD